MTTERLEQIIDTLKNARGETEALRADLEGLDRIGTEASLGGLKDLKDGWVAASEAVVGFGGAMNKVSDFTKEGAVLEMQPPSDPPSRGEVCCAPDGRGKR